MPLYRVPVTTVITEIFHVQADSAYQAMELALDDDCDDETIITSFDVIDGDPEVYYPDIEEISS